MSQEPLLSRRSLPILVAVLAVVLVAGTSASAQQPEPSAKKEEQGWRFTMEDRPSLRFGEALRVDLTSIVDFEWRGLDGDRGDDTEFGRKRIGIDGRFLGVFAFEVEGDVGDDHDPWRDVLVEFRKYRAARVRAGHFKIPFGAERLTSIREIEFARRSVVTETLTPDRDTGVQVSGRLFSDALTYTAGAFRHDGSGPPHDGADKWAGGQTLAGRVVVAPFARSGVKFLRRIETGFGYTNGDISEGLNSPVLQTSRGYEAFEPVYVSGTRQRLGLDANLIHGPFSVRGEFLRTWDQRLGQGLVGDDLPDLVANGWHVSAAWMGIGGLKNNGTTPRRSLFRGGIGAIQFAGRFEALGFHSGAAFDDPFRNPRAANVLANDYRAWTAGINWFPVRYVKLQLNIIGEHLGDAERRPDPSRAWSTSRVFRVQFSL
jgi:phosphate-selective porin OprO and OprP